MAGRRTPAIVVAERAGIWFAVHEYHHDPGTSSYGLEAARELGVDAARVFKTLIVGLDGTLTVVVLPVDAQLELAPADLLTLTEGRACSLAAPR